MFEGFEETAVELPGARIRVRTGGSGDPLLLLHGYPQTQAMWAPLAPVLAQSHRVVLADLRGYGGSLCHDGDFSFRAMAADQVALMRHLGHDRFDLVAHDRGARTAHRMALDHPAALRSVALLDILPTLDVWRVMDDWLAIRYYHWTFLAQPGGLPEKLVNAAPVAFLHAVLAGLSGPVETFAPEAMAEYERAAATPSVVAAWCGDYRAAAGVDLEHDRADLGRQVDIPCLVLWGSRSVVAHHLDPVATWRAWFPQAEGQAVEAGHFLAEERPAEVLAAVARHLGRAARGDQIVI
ncbi:alpha/beta fold hydrolase [Poseidonocella sp. HB161398]|uniref:alpha/beta fold hydrolase n=1 Tax=Poseidonocella sp. HB161398 TaxID=2320855 RepID=UPI0011097DA0|nr:alpha/beta hydrolase [Poseidonocella sp. HB161398]